MVHMNNNKIVHRDIKLANVFLHFEGWFNPSETLKRLEALNFSIKIGDLGFARYNQGIFNSYCGTPISMAPEILEKRSYTYKADIWSLGVLIYELYTGFPPFTGKNKKELKQNII